ncbi:MAG: hypothetical protein KatS3mg035_1056 [Bacteroidia bacterium]|nr:MAG: hypothetical protein KatS3mg035_1056 [Bacteroidia bacterium]
MKTITENEFLKKYKPQINHIMQAKYPQHNVEDIASFGGIMYETYGEEYEYICQLIKEGKVNHIWTVLDADGELIIQSGYRLVNRMGYIVTEQAWEEEGVNIIEE